MDYLNLVLFAIMGMIVSAILTSIEIPILKQHQFRQYIREEGPESHQKKSGTPTMGGIAMILALIIVCPFAIGLKSEVITILIMTILFGLLGFMDDYIKVAQKHNLGLRAWQKLVLQILLGVGLAVYVAYFSGYGTEIYIPFAAKYVDFGIFYIPFVVFVMIAMANSVNLTDGLDGLCSGVTAIVAFTFAIIGMKLGQTGSTGFVAVLSGACLGFLVFNRNPAKLFMGDTGSMALGGGLATAAVLMKMEFLLVIAGIIYVAESLSVIIQVISFQSTGKRVFRMSPIHHHFELGGMEEKKVVFMFWGVTLIACILTLLIYK